MKDTDLEAIKLLAELARREKSTVEAVVDTTVEVIEAPFRIAGKLFDDIFGL